ncbi:MAG: NAD(P)/FAD-dependent oxidoreductase [Chloroflexi bacterium]|nr:NAD(P)/FAD-dependent oxidoreductase [Chloroflexota bacterium]MCL5274525.1 NAD(P)/FAD-dependent oxidoreductase [Chloroflexota bacterium]
MKPAYDVVVIGAGPAGSIAARTTAQAGLSTLLIEKRQEIGAPVRCAEAAGRDTLAKFTPLNPQWVCAEIDAFSISNPQGDCVVLPAQEKTLVLERKIFDRELAHSAARSGAEVLVKAGATGIERDAHDGSMTVRMVVQGEPKAVRARIVVGADGTESQCARWAGLASAPQMKNYYVAAQYLLTGIEFNPRICQYHVGWSIAPAGYCWVFPKGDDQANVGLVVGADSGGSKTALDYLNEFIAARFPGCSMLAQVAGGIPITNVLPRMVADGFMAVGDAAHQSDPLTAGGITNGMHGGLFAAQVAVQAIQQGDTSARFLRKYEQMWDAEFGKLYRRLFRIRQAVLKMTEADLSQIIAEAAKLDVRTMSFDDILPIVLKSHPQLLLEAIPYMLGQ